MHLTALSSQRMFQPNSCDTFVAMPPATRSGHVVFGKNSDRPCDEVQEVIHVPAQTYNAGQKMKCTYIEIDTVSETYACVLSKPSWMWGAEMGSNEHAVCVGNEAIWTKLSCEDDLTKRLLGMDMVRLALERSKTASQAVDVITDLLETYGQGGPCKENIDFYYHNSFLIADRKEAWILETAGKHWAAEHVESGVRNISNLLCIRKKIDKKSAGLIEFARSEGYFTGDDSDFDFAAAYGTENPDLTLAPGDNPSNRYQWGQKLLKQFSNSNDFAINDMFRILRHEESDISRQGSIATVASQVSVLPSDAAAIATHWFTATPLPHWSLFKPFAFCRDSRVDDVTVSSPTERKHKLYVQHEKFRHKLEAKEPKAQMLLETLREMETKCIEDVEEMVENADGDNLKLAQIFLHMARLELNFYSM